MLLTRFAFVRQTHLFRQRQASSGNIQHRILLVGIARDAIFAAARRIDKLDFNTGTYAGKITIEPDLKRIGRGRYRRLRMKDDHSCRPTDGSRARPACHT